MLFINNNNNSSSIISRKLSKSIMLFKIKINIIKDNNKQTELIIRIKLLNPELRFLMKIIKTGHQQMQHANNK